MVEITGVIFKPGGKVYYFAPGKAEYKRGTGVIVETARGIEYATVTIARREIAEDKLVSPLKPIIRVASERDEAMHKKSIERKDGAMKTVREKIEKFNLDMKLIDCEFAFDGSKAVFYYTAPQRVDFRDLVKELSAAFCMRIELRQVGLRDGIQMLGGLAPCGRECCCSTYMPDIKKVSIKMAKNQGLSLNPSKISGLCGRLMCCLSYENDYYAEACKSMPKVGSTVNTPEGAGMVVNLNMLKMQVRVKIEDKNKDLITYKDFTLDELAEQPKRTAEPVPANRENRDTAEEQNAVKPQPLRDDKDREKKENKNKQNKPFQNKKKQFSNKGEAAKPEQKAAPDENRSRPGDGLQGDNKRNARPRNKFRKKPRGKNENNKESKPSPQ